MSLIKIKKGLDLPIKGEPIQEIENGNQVTKVALLGEDYIGLKPTMHVAVGDEVKLGQLLFVDKKNPKVKYTSPGTGKIIEVNRGEKRAFLSIVIKLNGNDEVTFDSFNNNEITTLDKEKIEQQLIDSGEWTAIRQRPFGKVANPDELPHSIFITAMDTSPLAPSMDKLIEGKEELFKAGVKIISKLTDGKVYVCKNPSTKLPGLEPSNVQIEEFSGPHPAGNVGTHIHFLDPVSRSKTVWHINLQDVCAIGSLFLTGKIYTERILSLAGPGVKNPRLIRTVKGSRINELVKGNLTAGNNRIISGSVVYGRTSTEVEGYVGRFVNTISVLADEAPRKFLGWLSPGSDKFSVTRAFTSAFNRKKKINFTTAVNGQYRAIVPIGSYEKVMPLDILPTFLLRSLAVDDLEDAEKLGCLELHEEDLALCTVVCPSKIDHGVNLRRNLNLIEKEG